MPTENKDYVKLHKDRMVCFFAKTSASTIPHICCTTEESFKLSDVMICDREMTNRLLKLV